MPRYPLRNGLALPVTELGYDVVPYERRFTTNHHLYFNRANYQDKRYRQIFRGLVSHVVTMPLHQHMDLHDNFSQPVMPSDSLMVGVIDEYLHMNGAIDVARETKTNQTYQILPDQWALIKLTYRS
jgi:hypothetical protein